MIASAYEVRWPLIGLARRVTYLVGKDHKLRLAFHSELDVAAHVKEVRAALARP